MRNRHSKIYRTWVLVHSILLETKITWYMYGPGKINPAPEAPKTALRFLSYCIYHTNETNPVILERLRGVRRLVQEELNLRKYRCSE